MFEKVLAMKKLNKNDLAKRINRQLESNFITLSEFKKLSKRKAYKFIKYISQIENLELKRKQIFEIVEFIQSGFKNKEYALSAANLWSFVVDLIEEKIQKNDKNYHYDEIKRNTNYRFGKFDLLRN